MTRVYVRGVGVVSPAGWGCDSLRRALSGGVPLPLQNLDRPGWQVPARVLRVPPAVPRPAFLAQPRLRRSTHIAQFAVGAALEALGVDASLASESERRLGIVVATMCGCVHYSRRFYDETLRDPATASPLLFPETVFNAPASHLAALLGSTAINYTVVGDHGVYLEAVALASDWLISGTIDGCVVVGVEEIDWVLTDSQRIFARGGRLSEGAGALYLGLEPSASDPIRVDCVTSPQLYLRGRDRHEAARAMRAELPSPGADELLCDGLQGVAGLDAVEQGAWADWTGPRISPRQVLGDAFVASAAWQCVAAVLALAQGSAAAVTVSTLGCNEQAIGGRFVRGDGAGIVACAPGADF